MTLRLVPSSEPVLRRPAKPVTTFDRGLRRLLDEMYEMCRLSDGVGLAAPQIGIGLRLAVLDVDGVRIDFVNPTVKPQDPRLPSYGEPEGCLSLTPGARYDAIRPHTVTVLYFDRWGRPYGDTWSHLRARVAQHEAEHLDGLLIDRFDLIIPDHRDDTDEELLRLPVLTAADLEGRHTRKHAGSRNA